MAIMAAVDALLGRFLYNRLSVISDCVLAAGVIRWCEFWRRLFYARAIMQAAAAIVRRS